MAAIHGAHGIEILRNHKTCQQKMPGQSNTMWKNLKIIGGIRHVGSPVIFPWVVYAGDFRNRLGFFWGSHTLAKVQQDAIQFWGSLILA